VRLWEHPDTGQPMTTSEWLDRLAPKAWAVLALRTCAAHGGIHAMAGNPTGAMGVPDYLGWNWKSNLCTCRACYLLFTREGAAQGKYKAVPDRFVYDPAFGLNDARDGSACRGARRSGRWHARRDT
jgi:NADH ubiquinone oxidoreductase, 20 Kd subunit